MARLKSSRATPKAIRAEVDRCFKKIAKAKDYMFPASNAVFECARRKFERGVKRRNPAQVRRAEQIYTMAKQVVGARARAKGLRVGQRGRPVPGALQTRPRRRRKR